MTEVRVGMFAPVGAFARSAAGEVSRQAILDSGIDHLAVGDHVSFHVGAGSDALIDATSVLATFDPLPCYVGVYLLPLRHPVTVARQLASISALAPGRLTLGVGIGGEDPHELEICGVDPSSIGRRMNESIQIVRALADGGPVSFDGEFYSLTDALILPAPTPRIPLIVGGRSDAAVRRVGRYGDGWLGIWVSPKRYATVIGQAVQAAESVGRDPSRFEHGLNVWCGFGTSREGARTALAEQMSNFYQMPFAPFERYSPYGTAEEVADFLRPYVEAGASTFNIIGCGADYRTVVDSVAEVRRLLAAG